MTAHQPSDTLYLGAVGRKMFWAFGLIGIAFMVVSILAGVFFTDGEVFWRSYMFAFIVIVSISLGGLFFSLLHHMTRASWSVVIRRLAEAVASNFVWLWVLFIPLWILMISGHGELIYKWVGEVAEIQARHAGMDSSDVNVNVQMVALAGADETAVAAHGDDSGHGEAHGHSLIEKKMAYLNVPFWLIRSAIYFVVWGGLAWFVFSNSVRQDADGEHHWSRRLQRGAPVGLILYALTSSFAAIDWMMSLNPEWFSTMWGVYFFAATCCGFFSFLIILVFVLQQTGHVKKEITHEHWQDMGKLLFAFGIVFWAYIAYSQYMLIWYANIPIETDFFLVRQLGPWLWVTVVLLLGHFVVPFIILVSKHPKRQPAVMTLLACWMLLMFFLDIYWLVMPQMEEAGYAMAKVTEYDQLVAAVKDGTISTGYGWHLVNFTLLGGMVCLMVAGTIYRLRNCALIPIRDPWLPDSIHFENM